MGLLSFLDRRRSRAQKAKARADQRIVSRQAAVEGGAERGPALPVPLGSHAVAWAESLAPQLRPVELMRGFPRVANRLALCWSDRTLRHHALEDLLIDRRGGRQGFPPAVRDELVRLRIAYPALR